MIHIPTFSITPTFYYTVQQFLLKLEHVKNETLLIDKGVLLIG